MAMDPEELVTLTDHGTMKLRSAVVRAMILSAKERKRAKILREGEPAILNFKQIRNLGAKWDEQRGSSPRQRLRTTANTHSVSWEWAEKPLDSPLTIDAADPLAL